MLFYHNAFSHIHHLFKKLCINMTHICCIWCYSALFMYRSMNNRSNTVCVYIYILEETVSFDTDALLKLISISIKAYLILA